MMNDDILNCARHVFCCLDISFAADARFSCARYLKIPITPIVYPNIWFVYVSTTNHALPPRC